VQERLLESLDDIVATRDRCEGRSRAPDVEVGVMDREIGDRSSDLGCDRGRDRVDCSPNDLAIAVPQGAIQEGRVSRSESSRKHSQCGNPCARTGIADRRGKSRSKGIGPRPRPGRARSVESGERDELHGDVARIAGGEHLVYCIEKTRVGHRGRRRGRARGVEEHPNRHLEIAGRRERRVRRPPEGTTEVRVDRILGDELVVARDATREREAGLRGIDAPERDPGGTAHDVEARCARLELREESRPMAMRRKESERTHGGIAFVGKAASEPRFVDTLAGELVGEQTGRANPRLRVRDQGRPHALRGGERDEDERSREAGPALGGVEEPDERGRTFESRESCSRFDRGAPCDLGRMARGTPEERVERRRRVESTEQSRRPCRAFPVAVRERFEEHWDAASTERMESFHIAGPLEGAHASFERDEERAMEREHSRSRRHVREQELHHRIVAAHRRQRRRGRFRGPADGIVVRRQPEHAVVGVHCEWHVGIRDSDSGDREPDVRAPIVDRERATVRRHRAGRIATTTEKIAESRLGPRIGRRAFDPEHREAERVLVEIGRFGMFDEPIDVTIEPRRIEIDQSLECGDRADVIADHRSSALERQVRLGVAREQRDQPRRDALDASRVERTLALTELEEEMTRFAGRFSARRELAIPLARSLVDAASAPFDSEDPATRIASCRRVGVGMA